MTEISRKTWCFNCPDGSMKRCKDGEVNDMFYKYVCVDCGSYSKGFLSGYFGTQYFLKNMTEKYKRK